jgi:hypothetical protein
VESYEFGPGLQRLSHIATMIESTDVDGLHEHMGFAENVATMLGYDPERLARLKRFVAKAVEFRRECVAFRDELSEADRVTGRARRELVAGPPPPADPPEAPTGR